MTEPVSEETAEQRLAVLGLRLPEPPTPVASYKPFTKAGGFIYTAGTLPQRDGKVLTGRLGETVTVEEGIDAAQQAALSALASVAGAAGGLEQIKGLMMLTVYVRSATDFQRQSEVADGASKLLLAVLGERGEHARVAVGVSELPREACVEVQVIARY